MEDHMLSKTFCLYVYFLRCECIFRAAVHTYRFKRLYILVLHVYTAATYYIKYSENLVSFSNAQQSLTIDLQEAITD